MKTLREYVTTPGLKRVRTRCADASSAGSTSSLDRSNWHATSRSSAPFSADSNPAVSIASWERLTIIFKPHPDIRRHIGNDHSRGKLFFGSSGDFLGELGVQKLLATKAACRNLRQ